MARKKSRSDLITGAFAVAVIAALIGVVVYLQDISLGTKGTQYSVIFEDVGGLGSSARVIVAGQEVGEVVGIDTLPVTSAQGGRKIEVQITFIINEEYADKVTIPIDTVAEVQMGSIFGFGGSRVVLKLGEARDKVPAGGRLPLKGRPPLNFNELAADVEQTIKRLQVGIDKVAAVLSKPEFSTNIEESLAHLRAALETMDKGLKQLEPAFEKVGPTFTSAQALIEDLRKVIDSNDEAIATIIKNFEAASGKLDRLMAEDTEGVPKLVASLNTIAGNLDLLVASLNDVILDNQLNVQVSLANVRETTESLRVFARRIERDPSLLIWGGKEDEEDPKTAPPRVTPGVDELSIRNSGRRPRKESD